VRTSLIAAGGVTIVLLALAVGGLQAQTQAPPQSAQRGAPSASNYPIAVVDVTYILERYSRLKQANEVFKKDAEGTEATLKKERDSIAKRAERLKELKGGTPDYKREEEAITKAESDWKLHVAAQQRDFAERESKNYLRAYQELQAAVKNYAERNGITLVLRFNGMPPDPNNRQMVQMEVFKMVLFYDKSIDITDAVLADLNRSAAVAQPPRSPAQPRRQ